MEPAGYYVFGFIFIAGVVGYIPLATTFAFLPATRTIDHPSREWRIFYRVMAVFMCNFLSFLLSFALLGALPVEGLLHKVRDSSELTQTMAILLIPLPLLPVLYTVYAKLVRWRIS